MPSIGNLRGGSHPEIAALVPEFNILGMPGAELAPEFDNLGMENVGSTCFMNSVLQAMLRLPQARALPAEIVGREFQARLEDEPIAPAPS